MSTVTTSTADTRGLAGQTVGDTSICAVNQTQLIYRGYEIADLAANATLTADIKLPELAREYFVELYPMVPYQIDFVIHVVSGLRTNSWGTPSSREARTRISWRKREWNFSTT